MKVSHQLHYGIYAIYFVALSGMILSLTFSWVKDKTEYSGDIFVPIAWVIGWLILTIQFRIVKGMISVKHDRMVLWIIFLHVVIAVLWILICSLEFLAFHHLFPNILEETSRKINPGRIVGYLVGIVGLNLTVLILKYLDGKWMK